MENETQHPPPYKGVLLDIDGTLIDSNDAHTHAWVDALEEANIVTDIDEIRPFIGMGGDKVLAHIAKMDHESPEGKKISVRYREIFRKNYLPQLRAFPGAAELLKALQAKGLKLAVATSASSEDLESMLKQTGLDEVMPQTYNPLTDADKTNVDPGIIQAAIGKLGLDTTKVAMLGDTPYDVEAAKRKGIGTISFRCGGYWRDKDLSGSMAIYDGPSDLLERIESSPLLRTY